MGSEQDVQAMERWMEKRQRAKALLLQGIDGLTGAERRALCEHLASLARGSLRRRQPTESEQIVSWLLQLAWPEGGIPPQECYEEPGDD